MVIAIAKTIGLTITFMIYVLFAALTGYDFARRKYLNGWCCVMTALVFLALFFVVLVF